MAKNIKPKPKADIDFEQELWNAANELRGAVAENQYKDYVPVRGTRNGIFNFQSG